jgi:hypothetical protein
VASNGLPMYNRSKPEPTVVYEAGGTNTQEISRGGILHAVFGRLQGQITLAAANNTRAKTARGDALALIRRLRIRVNSQENVVDLDGPGVVADHQYLLGNKPRDVAAQLGDGITANPSFSVPFIITFALPRRRFRVPIDTSLDCRADKMSKLEIDVDWGSHTSLNADATGFTIAPKITLTSQKSFDAPDDYKPGFLRRYLQQQTITATNPREIVRLATIHSYYGLHINVTDAGADSPTLLNRLKLLSGSNVFEDHDPVILNDGYGRLWHDRTNRSFSGASGYLDPMVSTKWNERAWYPLEIPFDGSLMEMQPAAGLAELLLELDITVGGGTTIVNTYPYLFVQPAAR